MGVEMNLDLDYTRIDVYKYTSDNWYPPYRLENMYAKGETLVKISTMPLIEGDYRVCAWGDDDIGMDIDIESPVDAKLMFDKVIALKDVTMKALVDL